MCLVVDNKLIQCTLVDFFVTRQNHFPDFRRLKCLQYQLMCSKSSVLLSFFLKKGLKTKIY